MEKKDSEGLIATNETVLHANLLKGGPRLTPTGKISHAKTRVYTQRYRKEWEQMPDFKGWLTSVPFQPTRAFCTYCKKNLHAHRLSLLKHTCTMKHQRSALMHQNEMNAKKAAAEVKIAEIEAELEDEPEEIETQVEVLERDNEEDDDDIEYVVERLEMDDEEIEEARRKHAEEQGVLDEECEEDMEDQSHLQLNSDEEEDVKPPLKKIKVERNDDRCRDALAEAMAHVHGEYIDENGDQVNVELEMVVESVDQENPEMRVMSILPDVRNSENEITVESAEDDEHLSQRNDENEDGDSSDPNSENELVMLHPSGRLGSAYQLNSSKSSTTSSPGVPQGHNTMTNAPLHNKTFTITSGGKTLTLAGGKFTPGAHYVLSNIKGKGPTLVMAEKKPITAVGQSENSMKSGQIKSSQQQQLMQSASSYAVAGTSQQSPKKHVILKSAKSPPSKRPCISTHVLDTSKGLPVGGLQVSLYKLMDGRWTFLNESNTTPNGRCNDLVDTTKWNFTAGRYKIHFDVDKYFTLRRIETMYPFIEIVFDVKNPTGHYHLPVLLSPFGYSTYRGSER
ncbi:uncharacterized protein LOC107273406 isoform X2 [Cephus cinctus]|uniref:hydroxyisourate hydrolase n=1 Tax=Cephus cinctus TaxID=211228 RepID=A0AAJ7CC88_CEPCN|nr:uncharacterized protein LOC107273406 isoform X2 [Cephus cinctus]